MIVDDVGSFPLPQNINQNLFNEAYILAREAIIQGGKDRLRPIVMTAITTIFGVLPLALPILLPNLFPATQGRAQMWAPISVAIIGGLTTSTFFTLIVLPTFYSISDSITSRVKKFFNFESNNL